MEFLDDYSFWCEFSSVLRHNGQQIGEKKNKNQAVIEVQTYSFN